jgi:hypothetical protein
MRKTNGGRKGRVKRHCPFEGHFALAPARTHDIYQRKWRTPIRGNQYGLGGGPHPRQPRLPQEAGCQPTEQR